MEFIEVSAKTVDDAITKACIELQAASDKLEIQVISEGSSGFFGIGSKPAVIRAAVKAAPEKEPEAPQKPEKKEAAPAPVKEAPKKEAVKKETERKPAPRQAENTRRSEAREEREVVQRTDEEIAQIKAAALEFLSGVFKAMELPVEIQMEYNAENGSLEVDFAGEDMGILIGKRGQTLDSLQYLTSLVVNKEQKDYVRVKLDTEGRAVPVGAAAGDGESQFQGQVSFTGHGRRHGASHLFWRTVSRVAAGSCHTAYPCRSGR